MVNSVTGAGGRDWAHTFAIYGCDECYSVLFLLFNSVLFAVLSLLLLLFFFDQLFLYSHSLFPTVPLSLLRFAIGFLGSFLAVSSLCLLLAAATLLHSSTALRWDVSRRMLTSVPDWSSVRTALDVGCGRGFLLNSIALQFKKQGSPGRVVGLCTSRSTAVSALHRACAEGVEEYVTCREGDATRLPFASGYFDVVVSSNGLGRAAEERGRGLGEMVRVLRPGGVGVVWDTNCVPEYVQRLREMRMEDVRVLERVTAANLACSHIISFRKPLIVVSSVEMMDWRTDIC